MRPDFTDQSEMSFQAQAGRPDTIHRGSGKPSRGRRRHCTIVSGLTPRKCVISIEPRGSIRLASVATDLMYVLHVHMSMHPVRWRRPCEAGRLTAQSRFWQSGDNSGQRSTANPIPRKSHGFDFPCHLLVRRSAGSWTPLPQLKRQFSRTPSIREPPAGRPKWVS